MKISISIIILVLFMDAFCQDAKSLIELPMQDCKDGESKAKKEIDNGLNLKYYESGLMFPSSMYKQKLGELQDSILLKDYNLEMRSTGCNYWEGNECYNKIVLDHLSKKFGEDIFETSLKKAKTEYKYNYNDFECETPDNQPSYVEGIDSMYLYLSENLRINDSIIFESGKRYVSFYIDTAGFVCDVIILKSPDTVFNDMIIDVFQKMGRWNPAICEGYKVKCRMSLPIKIENNR